MSIPEAEKVVQPRRKDDLNKKSYKKVYGYTFAITILFFVVSFLFANNFMLLKSYREITNQLTTAYKTIDTFKIDKMDLYENNNNLKDVNSSLNSELKLLRNEMEKTSRGSLDIGRQLEEMKKELNELQQKNKELVDDNIALQNSLKMAATVGVKPQSYSVFEKISPRTSINKGKYIGKFIGTAYTPSKEECGNNKGVTNSGEPVIPGVTVAIDAKYWPFGTVFYIKGLGYTVAMDTGSAIKGKYRFDFSVLNKDFARQLGERKWDVYLVKLGKGNVNDIEL